jgi:hypothetical protein
MSTIASQNDGSPALGSDELLINRSGTDFKLTINAILADVNAAISNEALTRANADTNLTNTKLDLAGGTMTGPLILSSTPSVANEATNKNYVDTTVSLYLPKSGGTMTGNITLPGDPTLANEASNKNYVDVESAKRWKNTVDIDCSSNPNYSSSLVGTTYRVTAAGKIGGVNGKVVEVNDIIYCHSTDVTGGPESIVGNSYLVLQTNLTQADQSSNGYAKIATDALIDAGSDDTTIMTPRGVRKAIGELTEGFNRVSNGSTSVVVSNLIKSTIYLLSGTTTGVVTVTLPEISTISGNHEFTITLKDAGNNAATNNIVINVTGSDTIDGVSSYTINVNSDKVRLINDGSSSWYTI